jgi:hypothetical protein
MCGASARAGAQHCPQCGSELLAREVERAPEREVERTPERERGGTAATAERETPPTREVGAAPPEREYRFAPPKRVKREAPPTRERAGPAYAAPAESVDGGNAAEVSELDSEAVAETSPVKTAETFAGGGEAEPQAAGGGRRERAASRVRGVKDNLKPRVERMRDDALVALEEAPSDSGLRFVVIAVLLFLLFIFFLVLSVYVLG